jgi:signal transduction histidine kinase
MPETANKSTPSQSTLADLPTHAVTIEDAISTEQVKSEFDERLDLPGVILLHQGRFQGLVSRDSLFRHLSEPFCRELFLRKPIREFLETWRNNVLQLQADCSIHRAAELALARPHEEAYDPILVDYGSGRFGLVDIQVLLIAQSQLLALSKVIEEQRDAAEAANRSKSEFLANISHELRTPLHGILSYAHFGEREAAAGDRGELCQFFQNVGQGAETLLQLVNDLLDLSKLEAGRMVCNLQLTSVGDLVEVVVDEFNSLCAQRQVSVVYKPQNEDTSTTVDPERFKQVIRNLLSNAVKFSPPQGTIDVRVRRLPRALLISVRDEGPGIPADELELVFDKFVQSSKTKSGSGGTGLGLAICREIVAAHKGRIWVENNSGPGCTFYCDLPLAQPGPSQDDDSQEDLAGVLRQLACNSACRDRWPLEA